MKFVHIISIVLFTTAICSGQVFNTGEKYHEAYSLLLDLKFDEASGKIDKLKSTDESDLAPFYLEDLGDFLFIVVTEDQREFEARKELRSERLKAFSKLSDESPYKLLAQGEIHLHWAFSKMRFGEYLSAARDINKAFHALEKNINKFPDFVPSYKSMGLLHTLIGTVPDNYRWATNLMGVEGTIEQGIREMESVISKSESKAEFANLRKETLFLLSFLHINLLNDKSALAAYKSHVEQESGPLMVFANASLLKESGKSDDAISLLESSIESLDAFPYLNFLLGELKLARMDSNADVSFQAYIDVFKGNSYLKSCYQKMAWHALLVKQDESAYRVQIAKIGGIGTTMLDEDKSAQKELETDQVPNEILLKARLQFDGGYYLESWKTLIAAPEGSMRSEDERLEWSYRLARVKHETNETEQALSLYATVVESGRDSKRYFGANASLQLGLIHEELGHTEIALTHFRDCSNFSSTEYRNSIQQKAKAGILRLSN